MKYPFWVSAGGLTAVGVSVSGYLEQLVTDKTRCPLVLVKILNLSLYGLSLYAVSLPGRIDSEAAGRIENHGQQQAGEARVGSDTKNNDKTSVEAKAKDEDNDKSLTIQNYMSGKSLLTPSGWAFAIWGPIFLGELVFVTSSALLVQTTSTVAPLFRNVSGPFLLAHVFQILWTASFRPSYKGNLVYISACMLSGIAHSLSKAHSHLSSTTNRANMSRLEYLLYFLPITMHLGWTTSASLVNWNGAVAAANDSSVGAGTATSTRSTRIITAVGHLSAVLATVLGIRVTLVRQAPVFGGVIAWALTACATGMQKRLIVQSGNVSKATPAASVQRRAERVQMWLCGSGAMLSMAASVYVVVGADEAATTAASGGNSSRR